MGGRRSRGCWVGASRKASTKAAGHPPRWLTRSEQPFSNSELCPYESREILRGRAADSVVRTTGPFGLVGAPNDLVRPVPQLPGEVSAPGWRRPISHAMRNLPSQRNPSEHAAHSLSKGSSLSTVPLTKSSSPIDEDGNLYMSREELLKWKGWGTAGHDIEQPGPDVPVQPFLENIGANHGRGVPAGTLSPRRARCHGGTQERREEPGICTH